MRDYELQVVAVEQTQTDDDLRRVMAGIDPIVKKNGMGFVLTISGWDNDPRDLWEIPEAIHLCKRLVDTGFISLLEVSTQSGLKSDYMPDDCPGLGALEIWLMANGRVRKGQQYLDRNTVETFMNVWLSSNEVCAEGIAKVGANARVLEGQQRIDPRSGLRYWDYN